MRGLGGGIVDDVCVSGFEREGLGIECGGQAVDWWKVRVDLPILRLAEEEEVVGGAGSQGCD